MPLKKFLIEPIVMLEETGKLTGLLLIAATVISLLFSNSESGASYLIIWDTNIGFSFLQKSILHWINDGLMPLFFLLVGIEIKRELTKGELASLKKALLPAAAALGGILLPAILFIAINTGNDAYVRGWAIPTATDIAFSLGLLTLLGSRVPFSLKVFLTALAIIDDLGAIIIIAVFYTAKINLNMLVYALIVFAIIAGVSRFRILQGWIYLILGLFLWYFILKSGIHSTIAGVLIATLIPRELAEDLEHQLAKPVNYVILPLFALANTAIPFSFSMAAGLLSTLGLGIFAGLFIGKPLGIAGVAWILKKTGLVVWPENTSLKQIIGIGFIAGIGFTMSIFISSLSFPESMALNVAKLSTMAGSLISAACGLLILWFSSSNAANEP